MCCGRSLVWRTCDVWGNKFFVSCYWNVSFVMPSSVKKGGFTSINNMQGINKEFVRKDENLRQSLNLGLFAYTKEAK